MRRYPQWLKRVEMRIGITFKCKEILWQTFIHRSYLNEDRNFPLGSNERLEFLGDKVLGLVVSDYLFKNYPYSEGMLTALMNALVRGTACTKVAEELELAQYIIMSNGQKRTFKGKVKERLLENTLEALIGAIYLDRGLGAAEIFISEYVLKDVSVIIEQQSYIDPKGQLQEFTQDKLGITPRYETLAEDGPDHNKKWNIGVFLSERQIGQGNGASKKEAETEAARDALKKEFLIAPRA